MKGLVGALGRPDLLCHHPLPGTPRGHFGQSQHCWGTGSQFRSSLATGPSCTNLGLSAMLSKYALVWAKLGWGRSHRDLCRCRWIRHSLERQMPQLCSGVVRNERRSPKRPFARALARAVSQGLRSTLSPPLRKAGTEREAQVQGQLLSCRAHTWRISTCGAKHQCS